MARESGAVRGWTSQIKTRTSEVETGGQSSQRCEQARRRVCGHTTILQQCVSFCPVLHRVVMAAASDCGMCRWHSSTQRLKEEVFVRPPKNVRKDKTIWRLLRAMYGTQVANSRWQRLVRETLCDGHLKVLTCVPCVAYNETDDSSVMCHGDDFLAEGHDSSLDKLDEVFGQLLRSSACRALVQQLVVKGCFCTERSDGANLDLSCRPDPKHVDALITTLSLEDARPVATPSTRDTGKGQANTSSELIVTEQAIYMSRSGLLQSHCTGQNGCGVCYERGEITNSES